jgi:phage shock protein PspC (stress-responsive transcriptional regulator)
MERKVYLRISPHDRIVGGVIAAMGRYANVNPNILRAGYIVVTILFPIQSIAVYGIIYFLSPKDRAMFE